MLDKQIFHYVQAGAETPQSFILVRLHHLAETNNIGNKDDGNLADNRVRHKTHPEPVDTLSI
jgi:hypothetical protein